MSDQDIIRHQRGWESFTTFLKVGIAAVVVLLIGMAVFLL